MRSTEPISETDQASLLRKCFVFLAIFAMLGTMVELAAERHWQNFVQLIPWMSIGVLFAAFIVLLLRPTVGGIRVARASALLVALSTVVGVYYHVKENHKAGFLDFRFAETWATMSFTSQWWKAASKTVGPAPTLAPAALVIACLCLFFATLRHPAFASLVQSEVGSDNQPFPELASGSSSGNPGNGQHRRVSLESRVDPRSTGHEQLAERACCPGTPSRRSLGCWFLDHVDVKGPRRSARSRCGCRRPFR